MADTRSWHGCLVMVGGGSAARSGLIFVAMTLHLNGITTNPVHRHRARTILMGLTAVCIRCGLVLMGGQSFRAVALEIIGVLTVVEFLLYSSIRQAMQSADRGVLLRTIGSFGCPLLEEAGAIVLFFGSARGLYIVVLGVMSSFIFLAAGAWLLFVGGATMEGPGGLSVRGS